MIHKLVFVFLIGVLITSGSPGQAAAAPTAPTFTVNSFTDAVAAAPLTNGVCETSPGNNICTLRAAIMKANHYPGGGVAINIPAGTVMLSILPSGADDEFTGDLNITNTMTINGVSAASTIIDANLIDGVIFIKNPSVVTISNVTITHGGLGSTGGGGGINVTGILTLTNSSVVNNRNSNGGGIVVYSAGSATLNNSAVSANLAYTDGGGIYMLHGDLELNNSTVNNNAAVGNGGGISMQASGATLVNSTISNNSAAGSGGGIQLYTSGSGGSLVASYSTIVGNISDSDSEGAASPGGGIYIESGATANLKAVLIAQNYLFTTPDDCFGAISSQGYNLIQTASNCTITGVTTGNIINIADALVDSQKNNGGTSLTRALLAGSPAINAMPTAQCNDQFAAPMTVDQRGSPRPSGTACDIGAYEGSVPQPIYGRNLVRNGDAEASAPDQYLVASALPNWTVIGENEVMIPYEVTTNVTGLIKASDPGPFDRGYGLFAGGVSTHGVIYQIQDVTSIAAAIDAGKVHYDLSAWVGGKTTQDDYAVWEAVFRTSPSGSTIQVVNVPDPILVQAAQRGNQTKLLFRGTTGVIPIGTRDIDLYLVLQRVSAADGYDDGYADNVSIILSIARLYLPLIIR